MTKCKNCPFFCAATHVCSASHQHYLDNCRIATNKFMFIPGGTFEIGNEWDDESNSERYSTERYSTGNLIHTATISSFYIQQYEVTAADYAIFLNEVGNQVAGGSIWFHENDYSNIYEVNGVFSARPGRNNHPMNNISWYGAKAYCAWLGKRLERDVRLPSEAQWEYAAGNGKRHTKWSLCDEFNANDYVHARNYRTETPRANTAPVGSIRPNDFGLYDMCGNVWEWCLDKYRRDWYNDKAASSTDPICNQNNDNTGYCVVRGGSWRSISNGLRSAKRESSDPDYKNSSLGFRCVYI